MYICDMLNYYGHGDAVTGNYTRATYERWWKTYAPDQIGYGQASADKFDIDGWTGPKSSFDY
jgi:hypothetical protein